MLATWPKHPGQIAIKLRIGWHTIFVYFYDQYASMPETNAIFSEQPCISVPLGERNTMVLLGIRYLSYLVQKLFAKNDPDRKRYLF